MDINIDMSTVEELRDLLRQIKRSTPQCQSYSKLNKKELQQRVKELGLSVKRLEKDVREIKQSVTEHSMANDIPKNIASIFNKMNFSFLSNKENQMVQEFLKKNKGKQYEPYRKAYAHYLKTF